MPRGDDKDKFPESPSQARRRATHEVEAEEDRTPVTAIQAPPSTSAAEILISRSPILWAVLSILFGSAVGGTGSGLLRGESQDHTQYVTKSALELALREHELEHQKMQAQLDETQRSIEAVHRDVERIGAIIEQAFPRRIPGGSP